MAPLVSLLQELGLIESRALAQNSCFEAGIQFARTEGILPAPEANHAVRGTIDEALRCKSEGIPRTILFNLCGHGHFDMQAYIDYRSGKLADHAYDEAELRLRLPTSPNLPPNSALTGSGVYPVVEAGLTREIRSVYCSPLRGAEPTPICNF